MTDAGPILDRLKPLITAGQELSRASTGNTGYYKRQFYADLGHCQV